MKRGLKLYKVDFDGMYVSGCLVIAATNQEEAEKIASETIYHTKEFKVNEVKVKEPGVIVYLSGDY